MVHPSAAWRLAAISASCVRAAVTSSAFVFACPAPAAFWRFGEQHPRSFSEGRIASRASDNIGELTDYAELLVPVECYGVGKDLYPDVAAVSVDVGEAG